MINITTSKGMQIDPDEQFNINIEEYRKQCNSSELIKELLHSVDGIFYIEDDVVKNKFGATSLRNISTGSKAVIIQILDPSYIIDAFDLGGNVFAWMNKHPEIKFNIRQHGGLTQIPEGVQVTIDDKYMDDRNDIISTIYHKR